MRRYVFVLLLLLVTGCITLRIPEGKAAAPVPLSVALADAELQLSRVNVFVLADATNVTRSNNGGERLRTMIANLQCYDIDPKTRRPDPVLRTRNPLVPMISGALQLQVQGQISTAGTFTVSAAPSAGGTLTRLAGQQLSLPMTLVSLSNLANYYIGQQTTNLQFLTLVAAVPVEDAASAAREKARAAQYVAAVIDVAANISTIVDDAYRAFDMHQEEYCRGRNGGNGPPVVIGTSATP